MKFTRRTTLKLMGAALVPQTGFAFGPTSATGTDQIDWKNFLARHDLVWDQLPKAWDEAPFLGNGMLGAMLYYDDQAGALRVDLGRSDVQDHRDYGRSMPHDYSRLPIGHFLLKTGGKISSQCALRLSLYDATLRGELSTELGKISFTAYIHAQEMALVINTRGSAGESDLQWQWVGEEAINPRQTWGLQHNQPDRLQDGYQNNPPGVLTTDQHEQLWLQPLLVGGGTATAWRATPTQLIASIAHSFPDDSAGQQALQSVRSFSQANAPEQTHRQWWANFYPASFVSLPDTKIESFYWIQLYKLASATRADRAYVDNQGPWLQPTVWPYATWNLNVQLIYWLSIASNQSHLAGSLIKAIHDHQENLVANVQPQYRHDSATIGRSAGATLQSHASPPQPSDDGHGHPPEMGNLPWALHDLWLVWRHTMDESLLRNTIFPVLRRTTNYYRHFLTRGEDGKLHLPPTYSPEYGAAPDLNYDLALLRWSCMALIDAAQRLRVDDPLLPEWQRILDDLVDYPRDAQGFLIGDGVPLSHSHRHYSHLLMIYPLYLVNIDQPGTAQLIQTSLDHWQSMPKLLRGYSYTGAASIAAAMGQGDAALKYLQGLFNQFLRPNTFYQEGAPVIETPLSGAQSVLDMLLQSWGGTIRPFPAVPSHWADCVFADLSAEGAFLVSAQRSGGQTRWLRIQSKAGEPFQLKTDITDPVASVNGGSRPLTRTPNGHWTTHLARGETIEIYPRGTRPQMRIRPVPADTVNSFGLNSRSAARA